MIEFNPEGDVQLHKNHHRGLRRINRQVKRAGRVAAPHAKRVTRVVGAKGLAVTKKTYRVSKKVAKTAAHHSARSIKTVHYHVAVRPHEALLRRSKWYRLWHEWEGHKKLHYAALAVYLLFIAVVMYANFKIAFAADLNDTWDFTTPSSFNFDSGVETSGSIARLKAQNYGNDANTAALFHLDSSSGTTITDSSSNSNTGTATTAPTWGAAKLNNGATLNGTNQNISVGDSSSLSLTSTNTLEAWTKFGSSFSAGSSPFRQGIFDKGKYQLYYDNETGKATYELENTGGMDWTQRAGPDLLNANGAKINRSWDQNGKQNVTKQVKMGSNIYVALGGSTNDAEVWKYDTGTGLWSQIGGDGIASSWTNQVTANAYEAVTALATDGTSNLYAGLGNTSGSDSEIWRYNGSSWTKIGGDSLNSSWAAVGGYEAVTAIAVNGSTVWAGLGNNAAGEAEVWRCTSCDTSPSWGGALIGGDGVNSSWPNSTYELVSSMTTIGGNPVVGLGLTFGDGEVWQCTSNCSSGTPVWTKRGGDGTGAGGQSWGSVFEYVTGLAASGNFLYVGTGNSATDAEVWRCDVSVSCSAAAGWTKIANTTVTYWGTTHDQVWDISANGTTVYIGLGNTANEDEVWRCTSCSTSPTWTKVGGDGVNSSWNSTHTQVQSVLVDGTTVYAGLSNAASQAYVWRCTSCDTSPTWGGIRIAGQYINRSWGQTGFQSVESSTTVNGKLYIGTGNTTARNATVWEYDPATTFWSIVGGQGIGSSWAADTFESVLSMVNYKNKLYVGIGTGTTEAEVWRYDGPGWTKVGGDGTGSSWNTTFETVDSLSVANGKLYAGIGNNAVGDGRVYECTSCDGTPSWTQIGGTASGNWGTGHYRVASMTTYKGTLYAGIGYSTNQARVYRYSGSGTTWTQVGGSGLFSSWNTAYEDVPSLAVYNGKLVAGLGITGAGIGNSDAEIWSCTTCDATPSWTKIGGDSSDPPTDNLGWLDSVGYERVRSMVVYNGDLYASLGSTQGDGEVFKYNGTTWTAIGGDGVGWTNNAIENVGTMAVFQGKLYVGMGDSAINDAMVWSYGDNGYVQSSTSSQDTNWHHITGRYNGTTMELLIDGVSVGTAAKSLTMPDTSHSLLIGSNYGSTIAGSNQGYASLGLDELRVSNNNRTSVTVLPYTTAAQTITLAASVRKSGVLEWAGLADSSVLNGGTINYRLSSDEGANWKYWTGSTWATSTTLSEASDISAINSNISTFPVTFGGITWQAILQGNGNQQVTLNSVTLGVNLDIVEPSANASTVLGFKSNGGASIATNAWTNGGSPYFTWTAGTDAGSGIKGYCLYIGTDNTADPVTTKGLLGTSPVDTGGNCQFAVSGTSLDLATVGYLASPLTTSNSPYYLNIKAIDNAGNVFSSSSAQFHFRFDNTAPEKPGFITSPSGFINTKTATLTWPTSGGQAASDANSGLAGLQYKINGSSWYGDGHTGTGDINDLLANDGSYTTTDPPDFSNIIEGVNTIYFRTWDLAGNVSIGTVSAALKVNTNGAPSEPQNVLASPGTNTNNLFSFSWQAPVTYIGDIQNITYCYTVNTPPTVNNCNFTSGGITSLGAGPYATQPGLNTFYVVARDESSNINYANYATVNFTANTPSPGLATSVDIVDVSIKTTSNWRLALTWEPPSFVGAGIASYKVYRSTDNVTFNFVGSSSSTTYIDAGLSQQLYYYKIKACDSTNNCGAETSSVNLLPTGKFTTPASLTSEPKTSDVTTKKAKIAWSTDRGSDSKVTIGTSSGQYSPSEVGNSNQVTAHTIDLDNLAAGTTYYYRAKWTDEDGNTGTSQEFTFKTAPAPLLKEVTTSKTTLSSGEIQFTSNGASRVNIYFGKTDSFGGLKTVNTSPQESTYNIELSGLDDGTKYYYKLSTFDSEGNEYQGSIFSFTTLQRPKISNVRFQPEAGEPTSTQKISWQTNVPTSSLIRYTLEGKATLETTKSDFETDHELIIRGLVDDSTYLIEVMGRDNSGNLANSDVQRIKTAQDTRPPLIKDITSEVSIKGTGAEARGQAIIAWKTDEPSSSQVAYAEGSDAIVFNNKTPIDDTLTTEHLVIVSDLPTSKAYSFKPLSKDKAGNEGAGKVQSVIVGKASDSVLTIILNTMQRMFGL